MTRVALVGLGTMGRNHLRVLSTLEGVELAAICDTDAGQLEAAKRKFMVPAYRSWDAMLDHERLDAVIVAAPTGFHCEVGLAVLERGVHVMIEKPIASTLEQGRKLVAAAKRARKLLAVGHIERFNPAVRELQTHLAAGEIGRLFQIQAARQGPFPARIRDVGVVIDLATHDLDVMLHLAGSGVQRLYAETEQRVHTEHEDILNALLKFDSGVIGVLQVNWLTPTKIRELSVLGERGLLRCNYLTQELTYFRNAEVDAGRVDPNSLQGVSEGEVVQYAVAKGEPLRLEMEAFIAAVRGEAGLVVDGEAGMRALHLALALIHSATETRVVDRAELAELWTAGYAGAANRHDL